MHTAAAILCTGALTFAGYYKSYSEQEKISDIKALRDDIHTLSVQIDFTSEPLSRIFERIATSSRLNRLWEKLRDGMKCGMSCAEAWENAFSKNITLKQSLSADEKNDLYAYFRALGKSDRKTEMRNSEHIHEVLNKAYERTNINAKKNAKLYRSLGALCGLGLGIAVL